MDQSHIPQISVDEVYQALMNKSDVAIVDVRTPGEFNRGYIEKAVNLPVDSIESSISNIISDKQKTIYVYCLSGSRSDIAVQTLINLGYTHAYSMTKGLLMWRSKKYSVIL